MSTVTVIFEDKDDGTVGITAQFNPVLTLDENTTPAQFMALEAIKHVSDGQDILDNEINGEPS